MMRSFFSMGSGERPMLAFLLLSSVLVFLPLWRDIEIGGMVLFGWLMAALMVLSPAVALVVFLLSRPED